MICLDTAFLIDLWRNKHDTSHPVIRLIDKYRGERFVVPSHAAGEFLEGGAVISEERLRECLDFLRLFEIGTVDIETAEKYAIIVSDLRRRSVLEGISKPDMWIAAWALLHGGILATRDKKHFKKVKGLEIIAY